MRSEIERRVRVDDGTELRSWRRTHSGATRERRGLLLVSGLLGHVDVFAALEEALDDSWDVCTWQLRGSDRTAGVPDVDLARHAADGLEVLRSHGLQGTVVLGWSTGAPVAAEMVSVAPGAFAGFVSVCGVFGGPVGRVIRRWLSGAADAGPVALGVGAAVARGWRLPGWLAETTRSRVALAGLRATGLVGECTDPRALGDLLARFARVEAGLVAASWSALLDHLAQAPRVEIALPSLWLAGARDPLAGPMVAQLASASASAAEFHTIPGGGHLLPLEQPELLALRLQRWAERLPPPG